MILCGGSLSKAYRSSLRRIRRLPRFSLRTWFSMRVLDDCLFLAVAGPGMIAFEPSKVPPNVFALAECVAAGACGKELRSGGVGATGTDGGRTVVLIASGTMTPKYTSRSGMVGSRNLHRLDLDELSLDFALTGPAKKERLFLCSIVVFLAIGAAAVGGQGCARCQPRGA